MDYINTLLKGKTIKKTEYRELYLRILNESDPEILNELVMIYFALFQPKHGILTEYSNSEIEDIILKAMNLIRNEKTRENAIAGISGILNDEEMSTIFNELENILTRQQKTTISS